MLHITLILLIKKSSTSLSFGENAISTVTGRKLYNGLLSSVRLFEGNIHAVLALSRSSCPELFRKIGALKTFVKFRGKHLCRSPYFNKIASLFKSSVSGSLF